MKQVTAAPMLVGILLIATLLRVWGLDHDLPYIYHPDEPDNVAISQNIFKTGDLNPHSFEYPGLFYYLNSLAYVPYYVGGRLLGAFHARSDILPPVSLAMGVTKAPLPSTILLGRIITVTFGIGLVGLTFLVGKRLTGETATGLLASLMVAIAPTNVEHSRYITPDTFVAFFATASFLAAVLIYQQGKTWHYVTAGILVGMTASTKYNGALIVLSLLSAHFLRYGRTGLKDRNLYLALLSCALGFLAATPFALIDASTFLADMTAAGQHYSTGHPGMEGNALEWYLAFMWRTGGALYILAILEILRALYSRSKELIFLSIFPLAYFVFISSFVVRNDRTFLPLTPFLFLLAASFLVYLSKKANELHSRTLRYVAVGVIACTLIGALIQPASRTIADTVQLTTINSRETARIWMANNLPPGSKIAIESYSPFLEPVDYSMHGFEKIIEHEPTWYLENGFQYLVFSEGMYRRFYNRPGKYSTEIARYDSFFNQFTPLKIFVDGDYEVRIYKVTQAFQ